MNKIKDKFTGYKYNVSKEFFDVVRACNFAYSCEVCPFGSSDRCAAFMLEYGEPENYIALETDKNNTTYTRTG